MHCGMCGKAVEEAADYTGSGVPRCAECVAAATVAPEFSAPKPPPEPESAPVAVSDKGTGFATAAMALGAIALSTSFLLIGGVFGLVGVTLGLISLAFRRPGKAMAFTGIGLSLAGLLIAGLLGRTWFEAAGPEAQEKILTALFGDDAEEEEKTGKKSSLSESAERWVGVQAPDWTVTTLSGETVRLSELRGRRVIVDLWASWCSPCVREIPHFQKLHVETPQDELTIVGVSFEKESVVREFVEQNEMEYSVVAADKQDAPEPFRSPPAIPTTYFLDRNGVINAVEVGYRDYDQISKLLSRADYDGELNPAPEIESAWESSDDESETESVSESVSESASESETGDSDDESEAEAVTVEAKLEESRTPLIRAALRADRRALRRLLADGQRLNEPDADGMTALMHASSLGLNGNVAMLLDLGARPNTKDKKGHTALIHAARNGRVGVVEMLLERGANRLAVDEYGKTALDWARDQGHVDVVAALSGTGRS